MTDLEIGLALFAVAFVLKDLVWAKIKRNQNLIDDSVIKTSQDNKDKIADILIVLAKHSADINHCQNDIEEQKKAWKSSHESLMKFNSTIEKFDNNSLLQHREMKAVLENNTKVMHDVLNSLKK